MARAEAFGTSCAEGLLDAGLQPGRDGGETPHGDEVTVIAPPEAASTVIPRATRFYLLDALRGLAALSVVLCHWEHFYYYSPLNRDGAPFDWAVAPFFSVLHFFYTNGTYAVELFFSLSGFIFFWGYAKPVASRHISAFEFAVLRFSRLYPLHFATLVAVALGQWVFTSRYGVAFVYPGNDWHHFALNLAFASAWFQTADYSFNGPVWSVSVEIVLYGVFFLVVRHRVASTLLLVLYALLGRIVVAEFNEWLGSGLAYFFAGGLAYRAYAWLSEGRRAGTALAGSAIAAVVAWGVTFVADAYPLPGDGPGLAHWLSLVARIWLEVVLFPLTIVSLALADLRWTFGRWLSILGDISYSSYLLHFPLQFAIVAVVASAGGRLALFSSRIFFVVFFLILVGASLASHYQFEMPVQRYLRSRLLSDRKRSREALGEGELQREQS